MEVDLPDMNGLPFMHTPEAGHELHARNSEADLEGPPPDPPGHEMASPLHSIGASPALTGSGNKGAEQALQDAALQPEDMPLTPPLTKEDNRPPAAQVRDSCSACRVACTSVLDLQ